MILINMFFFFQIVITYDLCDWDLLKPNSDYLVSLTSLPTNGKSSSDPEANTLQTEFTIPDSPDQG